MHNLNRYFKKAGGMSLLSNYLRDHVFLFAVVQFVFQGRDKKSLEILRLGVENKRLKLLKKRYRKQISSIARKVQTRVEHTSVDVPADRIIWMYWDTGIESAPDIVKKCVHSVIKNNQGRRVVLLNNQNLYDYVDFPEFIKKHVQEGTLAKAHFSDLLRLALLIKYGGTWVDSTVLFSGSPIPAYELSSDLFVFQNLKPGLDGHATAISNWFITAKPGSKILQMTYDLLIQYWKENKHASNYFIFHFFFQIATETFTEEWRTVVPVNNEQPHVLLLNLGRNYDSEFYNNIISASPIHKLTYKFPDDALNNSNSILCHLLDDDEETLTGGEAVHE